MPQNGWGRPHRDVKRRMHTPEKIVRRLAEGKKLLCKGQDFGTVIRHLEITESTLQGWRNQYGISVKLEALPEFDSIARCTMEFHAHQSG